MAVHNATLEQLADKVNDEEIITVSANIAGEEEATWAAKPSVTTQAPPAVKIQQQEVRDISNRNVEQLCALISVERVEELAQACISRMPGSSAQLKF